MTADQANQTRSHTGLPAPELGDDMHPLLRKLLDNIKIISIVFGAVVIIFGGYALYDYVQTKRLATANETLGGILTNARGDERVQALEDFIASAPEALQTSALMELAVALQGQDKPEEALDVWNRLAAKDSPVLQPVVLLGKAETLENLGRLDETLTLLEDYKAKAPESFLPTIQRRIAEIAEESGDLEKALASYRELAEYERLGPSVQEFLQHKITQLENKVNG